MPKEHLRKPLRLRMRFFTAISLVLSWALVSTGNEFFVLQGIDKTHPDDVLASPGVDGFTIRVSWRKLYNEGFAWLDEQISRGEELETNIQLRVLAGTNAPLNLPGVEYFDYLETDPDGISDIKRVPVPWDSVMHQHWGDLAAGLGSRYGNNSRIKVVHVPSFGNSSELHMPDEVTQLVGYSSRDLAESWIAVASPLTAAFPSAIVSLNYATPTQAQITGADGDWLIEEMAVLANGRAGFQANDLAADVDLERNKYQTLIEQQELGRHIGFQMVSSSGTARFGGEFLEAVSIASQAGASGWKCTRTTSKTFLRRAITISTAEWTPPITWYGENLWAKPGRAWRLMATATTTLTVAIIESGGRTSVKLRPAFRLQTHSCPSHRPPCSSLLR